MARGNNVPPRTHVRGVRPGYNPNQQQAGLSDTTRGLIYIAGGVAVATALFLTYRGVANSGESHNDAQPIGGERSVATAPAMPGMTESPIAPIASATPEASPTQAAPIDKYADTRHAAAMPFESCDMNGFTDGGNARVNGKKVTKLHADMLFTGNPTSETARQTENVKATYPKFILAQVIDGKPSNDGWITVSTGTFNQDRNPTFSVPANAKAGTTYLLGIEASATTPGIDGGHNTTESVAYCGAIQSEGHGNWGMPEDNPLEDLPRVAYVDMGTDY